MELLEAMPNYPYRKLNLQPINDAISMQRSSFGSSRVSIKNMQRVPSSTKNYLLDQLKSNNGAQLKINCLVRHEMFELLRGNPHSVTLMATLKRDKRTLKDIYEMLKSENLQEILLKEGVSESNMFSLRLSSHASIKLLEDAKEL